MDDKIDTQKNKNRLSQLFSTLIYRRLFLVDKKFQYSFILNTILLSGMVITIIFISLQIYFRRAYNKGIELQFPTSHPYFEMLNELKNYMNWVFIWTSLFVIVFIVGFGIRFSHRIAGPLHHLKSFIRDILEGRDPKPLAFRNTDYFSDLPELINKLISYMKK